MRNLECNRCKEVKPVTGFYRRKNCVRGYSYRCKECEKKRKRKGWRGEDNAKLRARARKHREENREAYRKRKRDLYAQNKERLRKSQHDYYVRACAEGKIQARSAVKHAVATGKLIKPKVCERCPGVHLIQSHHWSYEKEHWLDVEWLCSVCHAREHAKEKTGVCHVV